MNQLVVIDPAKLKITMLGSEIKRLRKLLEVRVLCGGCGRSYSYNRADDPKAEKDYGHGFGKCCAG